MSIDAVPDVMCTLTTKEMVSQVLEWTDLAALSVSGQLLANGAAGTFDLKHADAIEELAVRERDCCGTWLNIDTRRDDDTFHLQVTSSNPDGAALIGSFFGLA